jgi:hypothetical protein
LMSKLNYLQLDLGGLGICAKQKFFFTVTGAVKC